MAIMGNIAFENLRAEMGRRQLTIMNMASAVGMNRDTLSRKLSRNTPINLDEAFKLAKACFPDKSVEYLFKEAFEDDTQASIQRGVEYHEQQPTFR